MTLTLKPNLHLNLKLYTSGLPRTQPFPLGAQLTLIPTLTLTLLTLTIVIALKKP